MRTRFSAHTVFKQQRGLDAKIADYTFELRVPEEKLDDRLIHQVIAGLPCCSRTTRSRRKPLARPLYPFVALQIMTKRPVITSVTGRFFVFKRVWLILSLARPLLFRRRHVETRIVSWVDVVDAPRSCRIDLHDRVFIDEDVMSDSRRH
jgi:hypothetical protein